MNTNTKYYMLCGIAIAFILLHIDTASAEIQTKNILDSVLDKYILEAKSWAYFIQEKATWLFILLATISMVWTFSQLMFHRSSIAEFFGELIRFMLFTGFYLWLLRNGPAIAEAIISSMVNIGTQASNQAIALSPSGILDIGFDIFSDACENFSAWSPVKGAATLIISGIILVVLALVGINMLLLLCSAWVLAYAGIFFLGFGGSKWTSDMATNYFKTVLGIGVSLMTMVLLVGVGTSVINEYHKQLSESINLQELGILMVVSITLLLLVDKLPSMVAGIVTGASIGSMGAGAFGAGAAVGATMALGSAGLGIAGGTAKTASGVGSAVQAAYASAGQAMQQGTGAFAEKDSGGGSGLNLGTAMGTRTAFATEVCKALGKGIGSAAKEGFNEAVGKSAGGKVAAAINKKSGGDK